MSVQLYYTRPPLEMFEEIKREAIKIWQTYPDDFGYATEKVGRIKDLDNVSDNYMYMIAMFDAVNRNKLYARLSPATLKRVMEALA